MATKCDRLRGKLVSMGSGLGKEWSAAVGEPHSLGYRRWWVFMGGSYTRAVFLQLNFLPDGTQGSGLTKA